jgi:hypothetical protein
MDVCTSLLSSENQSRKNPLLSTTELTNYLKMKKRLYNVFWDHLFNPFSVNYLSEALSTWN